MVRAIKVKSRHRTMKIRTPPALRFILDNGVDPLSELVECASSPELGLGRARASTMLGCVVSVPCHIGIRGIVCRRHSLAMSEPSLEHIDVHVRQIDERLFARMHLWTTRVPCPLHRSDISRNIHARFLL